MNLKKRFMLDLPVYVITLITGFVLVVTPLTATAQQVPPPKCPPDCLMSLSLTDKSGKTKTSKGNKKTVQRQIVQFIDTSELNGQNKAQAKKQIQAILAVVDDGTSKAPETEISCQGGPTTSPTGGTGGTVTCGFKVKFGGGN